MHSCNLFYSWVIGRKAKKRKLEDGEKHGKGKRGIYMRRQQLTITCKKCGGKGHNSKGCEKQSNVSERIIEQTEVISPSPSTVKKTKGKKNVL
ncbi:hypothetical protein ACS0TY_025764 [Phlomoides rotata]